MVTLIKIILGETVILMALLIVFLILVIWLLMRKIIMVPTLTVAVDKPNYFKGETVNITGMLKSDETPLIGKTVAFAIKPPTGDLYNPPSAITDANGAFSASWQVPDDALAGSYLLGATALGTTSTTIFTLYSQID